MTPPPIVVVPAMTSADIQAAIPRGWAWIGGLAELQNVSYVDMPTSHWPMWTRPKDLAQLLGDIAHRCA